MNRSVIIAVAASVALFAGLGYLFTRGESAPDPELVATAELAPLEDPATAAAADVRLVRDGDVRRLVLTARDMGAAPADHHYELWLLDPGTESAEPVSLGAMSGSVTVPVPADVDLDAYDVVDVSVQADGQVEHSGNSVLRGTLA
jgi:anti-sigma-K factor RskA